MEDPCIKIWLNFLERLAFFVPEARTIDQLFSGYINYPLNQQGKIPIGGVERGMLIVSRGGSSWAVFSKLPINVVAPLDK